MRNTLIILLQLLLFSPNIQGVTCPDDSVWTRSFTNAEEIVSAYRPGKYNDCYMVWHSAEYILKNKGQVGDVQLILDAFPKLSLDDSALTAIVSQKKYERLIDHYYLLCALKDGEPFDAARDGITVDMRFQHIRGLNENDYRKLKDVFSTSNGTLHLMYLKKMPFLFQNNGCTEGLECLRPLIEERVTDSPEKEKVLSLYRQYHPLMKGKPAPLSVLKDAKGAEHTFAEFKGKYLVVDVWATWCSSCLKKMPLFLELSEKHRQREDIAFITLSIDRSKAKGRWLKALEKHQMTGLLNLMPDKDCASPFEDDYFVSGVPRYLIIDKAGNLVTAFAPSPGNGLEELVEKLLNDK